MPTTLELLDRVAAAARTAGHLDVDVRLAAARRKATSPAVRVVLVGPPGGATGRLLNALVCAPVSPATGTTVPLQVRCGSAVQAVLVGERDGDGAARRRQVSLRALPDLLSGAAGGSTSAVEVELPRRVLAGLDLVDTPGAGAPQDLDGSIARWEALAADVVWVVVDAWAPIDEALRDVVGAAASAGIPTHLVLVRGGRHLGPRDAGSVDEVGCTAVFEVDVGLADAAARRGAPDLLAQSGLPALVAAVPRGHRGESVHDELVQALADLRARAAARSALLDDPPPAESPATARERGDRLRRRAARWQQVLGDGAADLVADVEHDLRERLRGITRDADAALDAHDPGAMWDAVTGWLAERVGEAVTDNTRWAGERVDWLVDEVRSQIAEDTRGLDLPPEVRAGPRLRPVDRLLADLAPVAAVDPGRLTAPQKVLVGMRGSYSGVLMIGLVTGLAGLPLVNPVSVGAGLLIGGKAYRDDAAHRLSRRRAEAKAAVRRHVDEVGFQAGKQLRDQLRVVQRTVRDDVAEQVQAVQQAVTADLQTAQEVARAAAADRGAVERALLRHRDELAALERAVAGLAAIDGPTGVVRGVA